MELQWAFKGMELTQKKKKWVALMAAVGLTSYGFYRLYHLPAIVQKRNRVLKLLGAFISMAEAISDCSETIGIVSKDLKEFLQSESDQIPNSLKQVSKITRSDEFSQSITGVTQALTLGIKRGYQSEETSDGNNNSSMDQVMDKLFSETGVGFASAVVGSFARNLVMASFSDVEQHSDDIGELKQDINPSWLNVVCSDKCRDLIGDCVQVFVGSMVAVYLEKTKHINTYDEFFAGLTNPNHETQVRNVFLAVSNSAIETFVKASHQALTTATTSSDSSSAIFEQKQEGISDDHGWVSKVSSTLTEPSNRKLVLDVTGRITFEAVRSLLEISVETLCHGVKKGVKVAHEAAVQGGLDVVRYVAAKSLVVITICLSLCLHILLGVWILVPA